jgi:hypothetical protein
LETNFDDNNVFKGNEKQSFQPIFDPNSSLEKFYNCSKKGCNNDSDCRNCDFMGHYCVDNKCSLSCRSVEEGHSCNYESDCNPTCDIFSYSNKKYCVDKKCSKFEILVETNPFESSEKKDFTWGVFGGIMIIVFIGSIISIAIHICAKHLKKEANNRNRVSNLNSLRNSTRNASQLQSNQSRTISTSDQRNVRFATHLELNQMRSTSSRNSAIDDPPPSYAQIYQNKP